MKSPDRHKYYGTIKSTTEHWYDFSKYMENAKSNLDALTPTVSIVRRYSSDGRMTMMENYGNGELEYITEYKFNAENQVIGSLDIDPSGNPIRKSVDVCNNNGLIEECCTYYDMENVSFRMIFSYNFQGDVISETLIHKSPDDNSTTFFEYNGNTITSMHYDVKGRLVSKTIDIYDSADNLISFREYDEQGSLKKEGSYIYDIHNNLLTFKMKHYSEDGIEYYGREYEYLYDQNDNWINAIHRSDHDEYSSICIREIDYLIMTG